LGKILTLWVKNVGLSSSKGRKFQIFGKNLSLRNKSPWAIFTELGVVEGVAGAYPPAKRHGCGFKNVGLQAPKLPKLLIFRINLHKGGTSP